LENAALMSRLDQKFLIHQDWIPALLEECRDFYHILEVEGQRISGYSNRFIETPGLDSFHEHARGRNIRFKARIRQYDSNQRSFLEVKKKTVHGRTEKARIERSRNAGITELLTEQEQLFLQRHYHYDGAQMTDITCRFNRFTLVAQSLDERITFDTEIVFTSGSKTAELKGLAIMEVKQGMINRSTPMLEALKSFRFEHTPLGRRTSMSKYVVGMLLLNPNLPPRTYRSVMSRINRLKESLE
jgi:hypothetical protein